MIVIFLYFSLSPKLTLHYYLFQRCTNAPYVGRIHHLAVRSGITCGHIQGKNRSSVNCATTGEHWNTIWKHTWCATWTNKSTSEPVKPLLTTKPVLTKKVIKNRLVMASHIKKNKMFPYLCFAFVCCNVIILFVNIKKIQRYGKSFSDLLFIIKSYLQ